MVYQKILKGKIRFPSRFDSNAKNLVKHLLESDLTKRCIILFLFFYKMKCKLLKNLIYKIKIYYIPLSSSSSDSLDDPLSNNLCSHLQIGQNR